MEYTIKAHETMYSGVLFRSRLEARWAAFFDLIGWTWEYEPLDLYGWTPDFRVTFPCGHSECGPTHSLLCEVKPYLSLYQFGGHPCLDFSYGRSRDGRDIPADASAALGNNPRVSYWEMSHGAGGGAEKIENWTNADIDAAWKEAGNIVRYLTKSKR